MDTTYYISLITNILYMSHTDSNKLHMWMDNEDGKGLQWHQCRVLTADDMGNTIIPVRTI